MQNFFRLAWIAALLLLLSACGGGGHESEAPADKKIISGVVEDGPIAGARISLVDSHGGEVVRSCGASGVGRCETVSAINGGFSFHLPIDTNLDGVEIVSLGGIDQETGVDYAGIRMRAPASLFFGREGEMTISPLTTLLCARMQKEEGISLSVAQDHIRQWLGLGPEIDLTGRPSKNIVLERHALLLTDIALEANRAGHADPLQTIGSLLDPALPLFAEGVVNTAVLNDLGLNAAASARVGEMNEILKVAAGNLPAVFKRTLIHHGLREICERMLAAETTFDAQNPDPNYLVNLDLLTEKILTAAGTTRIPLGSGVAPQRIARYVFFTYGLTTFDRFIVDADTFAAGLKHPESGRFLEEDPRISELASLKSVYSASVPLLDDEIPGNDNRRRLEYFYNSDLSPFYFAEKVSEEILDDDFSDAVMIKIARGKADAGLLAEAETIVATQIFQTESRGKGYYELAEAMIDFGRFSEAIAALRKAESHYRQVIETKGYANINDADVAAIQKVGSAFRRAGDLSASLTVFNYLSTIATSQSTANTYGSVIVGFENIVKEYLEEGKLELAVPLIEEMYALSLNTPLGPDGSYKIKVFNLLKSANAYFNTNNDGKFYSAYLDVTNVRNSHSATAGKTWVYMESFVELLYKSGIKNIYRENEALSLAESMPTFNALKAYKLVATYIAVQKGLAEALKFIDARIPLPTDKIEVLTYFATNKSREYIALALINRNVLDTARQALVEAEKQMELLAPITDLDRYQQLLQMGYVKLADLYVLAGDPAQAADLLQKAEGPLPDISGLKYRVFAMVSIAVGQHALGNDLRAGELLDQAGAEFVAAVNAAVPPLNPSDAGKIYEDFAFVGERLLNACLDNGFPEKAAAMMETYVAVARQIFNPQAIYADTDHDTFAGKEVDKLIKAAAYRRLAGDFTGSDPLLAEAEAVARQLSVEAKRNGKLINVIGAYAVAGRFDPALALARSFAFSLERYRALQSIAFTYAARDDFPESAVASIDTDRDGLPDFFHPLAGAAEFAESALFLDEDSDGDGIPDIDDRRPLLDDPAP
jgi:hypothetical protein